ncbi:uncharacterized protein LOC133200204 [Saccostrea echinata]|uniref:uncharacterized protein LOC133200204 n=1 Tax=Saccostrea echinata TaxID=191078 RepID=UPI002A808FE5|nr:uncharacterized protein LOC133200204 [Saccostrea echinata]
MKYHRYIDDEESKLKISERLRKLYDDVSGLGSMGLFRQFLQLLWKNLILRKRQKHVLLLEVVWPVFIFLVVIIIRQGTPPVKKDTCSYNEHAMPSAGLVPFLQSTVCNLQNPCEARSSIEIKQNNMNSFAAAIQDLTPHFSSEPTLKALKSVKTGVKLANAISDISKNGSLSNLMNDTSFLLKKFFRDPDKMKDIFVNELGVMTSDVADALLNAELNIPEVLHNIGSIDFRDIVCDRDRLMEYMMFRLEVNVTSVSTTLCSIPENRIPEITNVVQNQIDVAAIIRVSKTLTTLTMDYTLTDALEDIATMTDLLYGTPNFMSIIRDLPNLKDLPSIMHKIPGLVDSIIKLGVTDLSWMTDLVKFLDPIIDRLDPDNVGWNVTKELVGVVLDVSSIANGKTVNMTDLIEKQKEVMEMLESRNMSLDWLSTVPNVNLDNAVNVMSALFSGNLTGLNETTILRGLNEIQNFTEMIIGNNSRFIMDSIDGTMDILSTVLDAMLELEKSLNSTFVYNQDIMDAFTTLIENGPNLTKSVVMEFIEPHNLLAIVNNTKDYPAICKQIVEKSLPSKNSHAHISKLENSLCSHKITKNIETSMQMWEDVFNKQIQPMIDNVVNGTVRRVEMATIYQKAKALVSGVDELYGRGSVWESIFLRMSRPSIDPRTDEWQAFFRDTQTYLIQGSWPVVVVMTGQYLENSPMWNTIGPIVKSISVVMQNQMEQNRKIEELTRENSTMMTLMKFVVNYSPEIATATMKMMQNATMIQTLATQGFTLESFCDNHMLKEMGMPSYVPVDTVENKICTTNWTAMMTEVVSIVDTSSMSAEITNYVTNKNASTDVDWAQMVYNIQSMVSMEQNLVSYMIESMLMSFNFSKISETMEVVMNQITEPMMISNMASNMSVQNLMSLSAGFVPTLQQLDVQLENVTEWKMVKYYVNVWNSISKMALEFLQDSMSDLDKYLMDLSPTFADFLNTVNSSTPSLFKALERVTLHPGVLLQKLLTTNLAEVCHGVRVSDLLDSPSLAPYEDHLCQVDWTQVYREVLDNTGLSAIFNDTMETAIHEKIYVNWNETFHQTEQLFEEVWRILSHPSNLTSTLDKFYNIQLGKTNMTWESLLSLYNTTQNMNLTKLAELANQIPAVLEMLNKLTGNSSMISSLLDMQPQFLYQTYSIQQFIINQLQYFNDTTHVTLSVYLNSSELERLFNQLSDSPAMSGVLYRIIVNVVFDPSKMTNLTSSVDKFCTEPGFLTPFVLPSDFQSAEKLRNYMCDTVNMNVTALLHELSQTHGLPQLMESLEKTDNFPTINMSLIIEQSEKLSKLITDIIIHPPTISLNEKDAWLNGSLYTKEFTDFLQRLTDKTTSTDIIQNGQLAELFPAILEMITKMTGNSSEFSSFISMQSQFIYQTYSINQFIIKQLQFFNDSTHITLTTYLSSPELTRLLNQISDSPEMSGVLFRTLVNIMYDAQKTQYLTNNAEKFCTEAGVLNPVVDPSDIQKAEKLRNYVCDTLNMNVTALWHQLSEGHGIPQLIEALQKTDGFPSINTSVITEQSMKMSKLITDLITHPPTISLTDNDAWLNGSLYTKEFTDFLQKITDKTTSTDIIQSLMTASYQKPIIDSITAPLANVTEFQTIVQVTDWFLVELKDKILAGSSDAMKDIIAEFKGYPQMERLLNLLDQLPSFYQTLLYNIVHHMEKVPELFTAVSKGWDEFCNKTNTLIYDDPSQTFSAKAFLGELCLLDFDEMMTEVSRFQVSNKSAASSLNVSAGLEDIIQKVEDIVKLMNTSAIDNLPKFMQLEVWNSASSMMAKSLTDPQMMSTWISGGVSSLTSVLTMIDGGKQLLQVFDASFTLTKALWTRFSNQKNESVLDLMVLLNGANNTQKLWKLIQQPGSIEVLIHSANTPQFNQLVQKNMTEALLDLCDPSRGMFTQIFTVPAGVMANRTDLQRRLCTVNLTQLATEWEDIIDLHTVKLMVDPSHQPSLNWTEVTLFFDEMTKTISEWLVHPPLVTGYPSRWSNESYWLNLLMQQPASSGSLSNITTQLKSILDAMSPFLDQEPIKTYGLFLEKLLNLTNHELDMMAGRNFTNLQDLVHYVPALEKLMLALNLSEETAEQLMMAPIKNPSELVKILTSDQPLNMLCSADFWQKLVSWSNSSSPVSSVLCHLNESDVIKVIIDSLKVTDLVKILENETSTEKPNWMNIIDEVMHMVKSVEILISNSSFHLNIESAFDNVMKAYTTQNSVDDFTALFKVYSELALMFNNTEIWQKVNEFLQTGEILMTSAVRFMDRLVTLDSSDLTGMILGLMKPYKLSDLFTKEMDLWGVYNLTCNATAWRELFHFAPTTNVTALANLACFMNKKEASQFITTLMMRNQSLPAVDIQQFLKTVEKFNDKFAMLLNGSSHMVDINMTSFLQRLQQEVAVLSSTTSPLMMESLDKYFTAMNSSDWGEVTAVVNGMSLWLKMLASKLENIANQPLSLSVILGGASTDPTVKFILSNEFLNSIGDIKVNPQKLSSALQNMNDSSHVCAAILLSLSTPANNATLLHLQNLLCSLNQSSVLEAAMTGFLANHQFAKQFQAVIDESMSGQSALNMSAYSEAATEFNMAIQHLVMKNWTGQSLDNIFNMSALLNSIQRLEQSFQNEMNENLLKMAPVLLQSTLGAVPDPAVAKTVKTVNMFLEFANDKLRFLKGSLGISNVFQNSSALIDYFNAVQKLTNNGIQEVQKMNFTQLIDSLMNVGSIENHCTHGTIGPYFGLTPDSPWIPILCADYDQLLNSLDNLTDSSSISKQLMDIWNASSAVVVDWGDLSKNMDTFSSLLTELVKTPPSFTLTTFLDTNHTMSIISEYINNPQRIVEFMLQTSIMDKLPPVPESFRGMYNVLTEMLAFLNDTQNVNGLADIFRTWSSLNTRYELASSRFNKLVILLEDHQKMSEFSSVFCTPGILSQLQNYFSNNTKIVSDILCTKSVDSWYNELQKNSMSQDIFTNYILAIYYTETGVELIPDPVPVAWSEMLNEVKKVMTALTSGNQRDWETFLNQQTSVNDTIQQIMDWLKFFEQEFHMGIGEFFSVFVPISNMFNKQIDRVKGFGHNISLSAFLPVNNTHLASLIGDEINHPSAAILVSAVVAPEMLMNLIGNGIWNETICNLTKFQDIFTFPAETDVKKIQSDLCKDIKEPGSFIYKLMNDLNVKDIIKIVDNYTPVEWQNAVIKLVDNIMYLQKIEVRDDLSAWIRPMMDIFSTDLMSTVDLESTCNNLVMYASDSAAYRREVEPVLIAVTSNLQTTKIQLQLQLELEDFMCDISSMNMSSLLHNLESKNISHQIQEYINVMTGQNTSRFECHSTFNTMKDISELFQRMINQTFKDSTRTVQCLEQITMLPSKIFSGDVMESIKSVSRLMVDGMSVLNQPFMQNNEVLNMITSVFQKLATEDLTSAGVLVSDLLSSNSTMAEKLQDILDLAPEAASVFLNATIKPDFINLLINNSQEAAEILCNPDRLEKYVELPGELMNSVQNVSSVLCGTDPGQAANTAKIIGDLLTVTAKVVNTQDFGSPAWWNHISADITDIIGKVQKLGLFNLTSIDLDSVDLKTVLPYIQELIYRNGPDALADSLVELLNDFKPIMNDTFMISVTSDIEVIIRGLTSLKAIRNFIPRTVLIRTVLKDPAAFHDYLTQNLTLSDEDATAIIEGTINYASLMSLKVEDFGNYVCNVTSLDILLNLTSTKVSISDLSKTLCNIGEAKAVSFVESMLQNMDLGKLVQEYVSMSSGKFLKHAQLTPSEVQDAVKYMSDSSSQLNDLANLFNNKSSQLGFSMGTFDALHGSGSSSVSSLYDMICGTGKSTAIKDSTGVSSISSKTTTPTTSLTPDQQAEQKTLPGEFCQNMYETIIQMSHGPVIWSYLKPLIMGKILYSPDTPATRSMIEKMYNSSFKVLAEVKDLAEQWSNGTQDLGEFLSNTAAIAMVKSLDGNNFINNLLESTLQVSSADVMNGFYTLDTLSSNEVLNISSFFRLLANYTQCVSTDRFVPMSTERDMELMAVQLHQNNTYLAGIAFQMETTGRKKRQATDSIPKHVVYKIKMDIENVESTRRLKEKFWRPYPEDDMFLEMRYFRGFIQLQDMLDRAIINLQTGSDVNNTVFLQQFPTPCYVNDKYMELLSSYLLPIMMTIAWLAAISVATKNLVYDRENGQEEALKIMGLNSVMTWWVWFLSTMVVMTIISLICLLLLRVGGLFTYTNFGIIILYFLAFCFSSTMLCYMVGAFFTQATLAILFVVIIYLLSYLPYIILIAMSAEMEFWQQILACLSSTTAFGFGSQYLAHYEIQMTGIHWNNLDSSPIEGDQMNFHWCLVMMALDGVIYLLIGWYVRGVKPGKYGVPEPWYFPLSPYYWGCIKSTVKSADKYRTSSGTGALLEEYSKDRKVGMSLRHLSKKFGNQEVVKDLNCDFFEGQVTVLLGHNGAAKSTTLNMMCGILQPTHGKVSIYGHRARHGAKKIGICPQYNALFHYMTVREHLEFYSAIKSDASKSKIKKEVDSLLHDVDLWNVQDAVVSTLSGGMQRRLCVALAFAGDSKAVILDEPTSGVDPSARRSIWNLLVKRKMRCTILLSTHFLDEADTIGDRIAVMHKGQILCTGSPMFLKEKVGSGYHLRFAKADTCNTNEVLAVVRNFTPEAEIVTEVGSEVIMSLPFSNDQSNQFFKCLYNLDKAASSLGVNNYGVYDTTLEEVFQKVCSVADKDMTLTEQVLQECRQKPKMENPEEEQAEDKASEKSASYSVHFSGSKRKGLIGHKLGQFTGMLIKRFHHYRRDWRMFLSVFLLPLVFMTASLGLMELQPQIGNAPAKVLTPPLYGPRSHAFIKDNVNSNMTRYMVDSIKSRPGFGTTCMKDINFGPPFECVTPDAGFSTVTGGQKYDNCSCVDNKYVCSHRTMYQDVPLMTTRTTTQLYNLQDKDIDLYLLQTSQRFLWNRFGGLSFDPVSGDPTTMKSTVWFNNKGRHALPSFYNALSNTMLRATLSEAGMTDTENFGITAINEPILLHEQQLTIDTLTKKASDVGIGLFMLVAFSFIPVGFTMYVLNELLKKEKQLLFLSGTGPLLYWFTAILWDMFLYCLTVALTVAIMAIFQNPVYWERSNLVASVLLVILYGWASIPLMYSMMKLFRDTSTAYMVLFCGSVFIGITTACCTFLLEYFSDSEKIQEAFEILSYVFLVFPQFSYVNGFLKLTANQLRTEILSTFKQDAYVDPFSFDMLAWNYIAMAIQGAVFFIITLLTEFSCHCSNRVPHSLYHEEEKEDEDVGAERARIRESTTSGNSVTVSNLSKVYRRGGHDFLAVNQLCFGVKKGECFGLLGVNGAGKTTTFRMLTGDIKPSSGAAFIKNHRIAYGESSLGRDLGYCPQEEALDRYLTGGEMLHFYARMRGLPRSYRNYTVQDLIQRLKLASFVDKPVHTYSGGMKRKLSVAIALLGEPNVVFLDEPTTGMDPTAKRQVWNCVLAAIKNGQSVVMTSHSMEECDAICTRLAIMVNGSFQCIGSSQHLKDKFGSGHTVTISQCGLPSEREGLMNFFEARFPGSIFRVQHQGMLEVQVPSNHTSVADVIQVLDEQKCRGVIQNYSVSQTTLDDVFLSFSREQTDGVGAEGEDSYTDFSSDASENVSQISSSIAKNQYAYMNPGYAGDKGEKMGQLSAVFINPEEEFTAL